MALHEAAEETGRSADAESTRSATEAFPLPNREDSLRAIRSMKVNAVVRTQIQ